MAWSLDRKRFVGALSLFLLWVVLLSALAIVSAYRPAARSPCPTSRLPPAKLELAPKTTRFLQETRFPACSLD